MFDLSSLTEWKYALLESIERIEAESAADTVRQKSTVNLELIGLTAIACLSLSGLEYFGSSEHYMMLEWPLSLVSDAPDEWLSRFFEQGRYPRLMQLGYWSISAFVGYVFIPCLYVRYVMNRPIRSFGLSTEGVLKHSWIYVVLFLTVFPAILIASFTEPFQKMYPFYDNAPRSVFDFMAWEFLYAFQFFSLEFFFRGFLIHGLKKRFGLYSIAVSVIPYCMIHFGKPFPETLGAIIAGLVLGLLSLLTGSIWLGVAIHVSVAVSMDVLAITW